MDFNIGDKVKFLNETGGGTITKIIDKGNVIVMTDYNFEVPSSADELLLIESANNPIISDNDIAQQDEQEDIPEENISDVEDYIAEFNAEIGDEVNLYLSFVIDDSGKYELFLINDSNYNLQYVFSEKDDDKWLKVDNQKLESNTKLSIKLFSREQINNRLEFLFQAILYMNDQYAFKEPVSKIISINPVKFFKKGSFKQNDFFDTDALLIGIYNENKLRDSIEKLQSSDLYKVVKHKEDIISKKITNTPNVVEEVDLHLQEVIDDPTGLSKKDMLEVQLNMFRKKLNEAISNKQKKIVFIHGLGNGRLKSELRNEIDTKYKNCKYQDASFQQYGFGATLVMIY